MSSIRALAPEARLRFIRLDLADLTSIASFATSFSATYDRLDLLINNAGLMAVDESRTVDGSRLRGLTSWLMRLSAPLGQGSAAARALPLLRAATDPAVVGGQFYGPRWGIVGPPVLETPSQQARDVAVAPALWKASADLTHPAVSLA